MLVVDSSVWIDFFKGVPQPSVLALRELLFHGEVRLVVPDLVLFEVLRGFRHDADFRQARRLLESLEVEETSSAELALAAAQHYRKLRAQGFTVRSSIDVLVASFCIENDYGLLHRDRDFLAFQHKFGLRTWTY